MPDSKRSTPLPLSRASSSSALRRPIETILLHGLASPGILLEMEELPFGVVLASPTTLHSKISQLCNCHRNSKWNRMKRSPVLGWREFPRLGVPPEPASWPAAGCLHDWFLRRVWRRPAPPRDPL